MSKDNTNIQPTGFPIIVLAPEDIAELRERKNSHDAAAEELRELQAQIETLNKRAAALRDVIQHNATGMRIKKRALLAANEHPESADLAIDMETGEAKVVTR